MKVTYTCVVSDLHAGSNAGLCPPEVLLDGGGMYGANPQQKKVWEWYLYFCNKFVPWVTRGKKYDLVINGDAIEGIHHKSIAYITGNKTVHNRIAKQSLDYLTPGAANVYYVKGTEAHGGASGENEEALAEMIKAKKDKNGDFARFDLWQETPAGLIHYLHHIGTTGRSHFETSALMAELIEEYVEAGRYHEEPPACIVRSHRHRYIGIDVPTDTSDAKAVITPGWQLKTPFTWKIPGARITTPMLGGVVIETVGQFINTYPCYWKVERSERVKANEYEEKRRRITPN